MQKCEGPKNKMIKLSKKSLVIQTAILLLAIIITYLVTVRQNNAAFLRSYGNLIGYELSYKVGMLEEANNETVAIPRIRYSMERDILRKLMEASAIRPKIDDLQGAPIDALHKIIEYQKNTGFLNSAVNDTDKEIRRLALGYLNKIEPEVSKLVEKRKEAIQALGENLREQSK